jgi:hypothetical protein
MRLCAIALGLLVMPLLAAHPLDDKADMASRIVVADDARLELVLEFRYRDVRASYAELAAGLDRDLDGAVTRQEARLRFLDNVDPLALAITINVNGRPVNLEADLERCEFADLDNPAADLNAPGGAPAMAMRIFYRFVFTARPDPGPGVHAVEYFFSGPQAVVHDPRAQMLPLDARDAMRPVAGARWDTTQGMPRVRFEWRVGTPPPAPAVAPAAMPPTPEPPAEPERLRGLGEVPAWLTLVSGLALVLASLVLVARRVLDAGRRGRWGNALALGFAGLAIVLGALMRLGYFARL